MTSSPKLTGRLLGERKHGLARRGGDAVAARVAHDRLWPTRPAERASARVGFASVHGRGVNDDGDRVTLLVHTIRAPADHRQRRSQSNPQHM